MKNTCPTCDDPCPHCPPVESVEVTISFPVDGYCEACEGCECNTKDGTCHVEILDD